MNKEHKCLYKKQLLPPLDLRGYENNWKSTCEHLHSSVVCGCYRRCVRFARTYRQQKKRTFVLTLQEISAQRLMCSFSHS